MSWQNCVRPAAVAVGILSLGTALQSQGTPPVISREQIKALVITIRPTLFDPPSANTSGGKVMLVVQNGDGLRAHSYLVQQVLTGGSLLDITHQQTPVNAKHWFTHLTLVPGQYRLSETGTGNRAFVLTVQ